MSISLINSNTQKQECIFLGVLERAEKSEQNDDDLLNSEVNGAGVLLKKVARFKAAGRNNC